MRVDLSVLRQVKLIVSDFDGVFTNNLVYVDENGVESVACNRSDLVGIKELKKNGIDFIVLSKEKNNVVQVRCNKLNLECYNGIDDKKPFLEKLLAQKKLMFDHVCYIGNDVNDLECIQASLLGVAVQDAFDDVKVNADYITTKNGGGGAIRELIELILSSQETSNA